ncbi:MAG: helix-turn-helix domain-containing protein [Burkholderiaceae bacterium]|nr:helix-turn-helix domain-containing protein [Burkholderiaceae bacterium]
MKLESIQAACSACSLQKLCMPIAEQQSDDVLEHFGEIVDARRKVKRKEPLFLNGDQFTALYAVRTGVLKTQITTSDGRAQVTGFQIAGDIVGFDGIASQRHACSAIALEDSEVCLLPFDRLEQLSRKSPAVQHYIYQILGREIVREHLAMLTLGSMLAEERVATFLIDLAERLHARGFSRFELVLRMTREEIGSYLGIKLETVSRTLTKFVEEGLINVRQRHILILDPAGLERVYNPQAIR